MQPTAWESRCAREEQRQICRAIRRKRGFHLGNGRRPKWIARLPRRVAHVHDDVRERHVVERGKILRQLESPRAHGSGSFKGQKALVSQVGLKHSTVVASGPRDDGVERAKIVGEAAVPISWRAYAPFRSSGDVRTVAPPQRQGARYRRVRTDYLWKRQRHRQHGACNDPGTRGQKTIQGR